MNIIIDTGDEPMKKGMYLQDNGKTLLVKNTRQLLVLTQEDIEHAVAMDWDVMLRALKRGKSEQRIQQNQQRYEKWVNQGDPNA